MRVDTGRLRVVAPQAHEVDPAASDAPVPPGEPVGEAAGAPSPGSFVREQRRRRGMSLEQLAAATKIPPASLRLIEEDRFEDLPAQVFAKGFLRCCARALGLPADRVLELFDERERARLVALRRQVRPASGPFPAARDSGPARAASSGAWVPWARVRDSLGTTNLLLWLVVALFVAVVVSAAFHMGSAAGAAGG